MVDLPIRNCDFSARYVGIPEGKRPKEESADQADLFNTSKCSRDPNHPKSKQEVLTQWIQGGAPPVVFVGL